MNQCAAGVIICLLALLLLTAPESQATWIPDGVPVCTASGIQRPPAMISDGSGGWYVAWVDERSGYDIYAQHLNALGAPLWTANGILLGSGNEFVDLVSDGAGGVIVAWTGSGSNPILAQRINSSGVTLWTAGGVLVNPFEPYFTDYGPHMVSDGAGGAIIAWQSFMYDGSAYVSDVNAQRLNAAGVRQWNYDYAVVVCAAPNDQFSIDIATDGAGGAIASWADLRNDDDNGLVEVYAQRVDVAGATQWTTNGIAICAGTNNQANLDVFWPKMTADGMGGAIIAWEEAERTYGIYAQHVNSLGIVQWTTNGIPLCTATGSRFGPLVVSDEAGGAIIAWREERDADFGLFAQRVDASGALQWTSDGVTLCTTDRFLYPDDYDLCSDDESGAIIAWTDDDDPHAAEDDIYSQRVTASGTLPWGADGVVLCSESDSQSYPDIASDGFGGAAVAWYDRRNDIGDIYADFVNPSGGVGELSPTIASIIDVPQDQGGWVRVIIDKSHLDDEAVADFPISLYNVWQRVDNPALLAAFEQSASDGAPTANASAGFIAPQEGFDAASLTGLPVFSLKDRIFIRLGERGTVADMLAGTWELLGSFAACQHDQYIYRASTLADSTAEGIPYSVYMVSAHTTTPSVWFASEPDSGYSVDNLPPEPPVGLAADQSFVPEGLALTWDTNTENDLAYYAVYRGLSGDFIPGPGNLIATPTAAEYFDGDWRWDGGYYYKISAFDENGNESGHVLVSPDNITDVETPEAPRASYLAQNYPNPFNPTTRITFGLAAPGNVSVRIYDAAGRLVRVLAEGMRAAGHYTELWDGRDSRGTAVASGIYFCRLSAGAFEETRKLTLLR